jgi:hypothetical protein
VLKGVLAHFINATNIYLEIFLGFSYVLLEHIFSVFSRMVPLSLKRYLKALLIEILSVKEKMSDILEGILP